jgi:hypothetical protein
VPASACGRVLGRPPAAPRPAPALRRAAQSRHILPLAMDQKLARKNVRSGLLAAAICFFMFGMTFVAAAIYVS